MMLASNVFANLPSLNPTASQAVYQPLPSNLQTNFTNLPYLRSQSSPLPSVSPTPMPALTTDLGAGLFVYFLLPALAIFVVVCLLVVVSQSGSQRDRHK